MARQEKSLAVCLEMLQDYTAKDFSLFAVLTSPIPLKSPCQVHATYIPHTNQTVNRFLLPLSQD